MFEMFEKYGKQITDFLSEARTLLGNLTTEVAALRAENGELKAQVTRIEGAHMLLMEWLAEIDEEESDEVLDETEEAAETAVAAAEVAVAASETAQAIAVEEVEQNEETEEVQETVPPAVVEEKKEGESPESLPETPVPEEPPAEPEEVPVRKQKRSWI
jgi:hypothetical protein